jgi:uncharacterized protein
MPGIVVDRRTEHKAKSTTSRDRFIKRYKKQIQTAVAESVKKSPGFKGYSDKGKEYDVSISNKNVGEPVFRHGPGGEYEFVLGGNDQFVVKDQIAKPPRGGNGSGSGASTDDEREDNFLFTLTREEFLNMIFDDLSLPEMVKKNMQYSTVQEMVHAGFTKQGSPGNLDVSRSFKVSLQRRIGLSRRARKLQLAELERQLTALGPESPENIEQRERLLLEIEEIRRKLRSCPFFDPNHDLRFRHRELEKLPTTSAVMFCLMDVSGSVTESMKNLSKGFLLLLHLFLQRNYKNVDVVFIRHTQVAKECDEHEFFYGTETGGTIVSSCLEEMKKIIRDRYDTSVWNIYAAQLSDGDNWDQDNKRCVDLLEKELLGILQYMVYVQVSDGEGGGMFGNTESSLWSPYNSLQQRVKNFKIRKINDFREIYPTFRSLFVTNPE